MRDYIEAHYFGLIRDALGKKEMPLTELVGKVGIPRCTLTRYVDIFTASGKLAEKQDGRRKLIRVAKAK